MHVTEAALAGQAILQQWTARLSSRRTGGIARQGDRPGQAGLVRQPGGQFRAWASSCSAVVVTLLDGDPAAGPQRPDPLRARFAAGARGRCSQCRPYPASPS